MPTQRTRGFCKVVEVRFDLLTPVVRYRLQNTHAAVLGSTFQICSEERVAAAIFADHHCDWAFDVVIEGIATLMSAALGDPRLTTLKRF